MQRPETAPATHPEIRACDRLIARLGRDAIVQRSVRHARTASAPIPDFVSQQEADAYVAAMLQQALQELYVENMDINGRSRSKLN